MLLHLGLADWLFDHEYFGLNYSSIPNLWKYTMVSARQGL